MGHFNCTKLTLCSTVSLAIGFDVFLKSLILIFMTSVCDEKNCVLKVNFEEQYPRDDFHEVCPNDDEVGEFDCYCHNDNMCYKNLWYHNYYGAYILFIASSIFNLIMGNFICLNFYL